MFSEKLINFNVIGADPKKVYYTGYTVTPKGQRAYEEFISFQTIQKSNTESLNVAKEANMLSAKANELSAEANLISKDAKRLSFWAIVISAIAAGISIVGIIVSALT